MAIACPYCRGLHVQRCEIIYRSGTSEARANTTTQTRGEFFGVAAGASDIQPFFGSFEARTRSQTVAHWSTELARTVAPPLAKPFFPKPVLVLGALLSRLAGPIPTLAAVVWFFAIPYISFTSRTHFLEVLIVYAIAIFLAGLRFESVQRYNRTVWAKAYRQWQYTWFCHSCGAQFIVGYTPHS